RAPCHAAPPPTPRDEQPAGGGKGAGAAPRPAGAPQRDRHAEGGQPRHERDGAVQGIDDPAPVGPGGDGPALLPEEPDPRESSFEPPPDLALRCPVGARHGISSALELDGAHATEPAAQEPPPGPGPTDGRPPVRSGV